MLPPTSAVRVCNTASILAAGDGWDRESPSEYQTALGSLREAMLQQVEGQIEDAVFKLNVLKRSKQQEDGKNAIKLAKYMQRTRR